MANTTFDVEYDVAVVGGGAAGKAAALTAARGGLQVVILEKMGAAMGSAQHAEGACAFESSEQKAREGGSLHMPTKEEGYHEYMRYSHYRANAAVVNMFVENSADAIEMLKDVGVEFEDVVKYLPDMESELASMHIPKGLGMRCQELLLKAVKEAGIDIFVNTRVEHLIMDGGKVIGVEAKDAEGDTTTVGAKAVIIATGGYGCSPELMKKYNFLGGDTKVWTTVPPVMGVENTGDGFALAEEAGGVINGGGVVQLFACGIHKLPGSESGAAGTQPSLWVNKKGRRFINEDIAKEGTFAGTVLAGQEDSLSYGIIDADMIKYLQEVGSDTSFGAFLPLHKPMTHLLDELEADMAAGNAWKADSMEELADKMGIDKETFLATVKRYNELCEAGYDSDFHKDPHFLKPLRKAPFYAILAAPDYPTTCGGIMVNENLQVLDSKFEPIPGLFAAGNDASGLYGDSYTMTIPGSTNGFAHTSGRVAAKYILSTLKA